MTELLAPAGNREKLETAIYFGADAVYLAGKDYGLRAYCDNFDDEALAAAVAYCHARGKRVYVTLNIYAYTADLPGIAAYAKFLRRVGADGVILSDPGVLVTVREAAPELAIHLSTQANTTNAAAAKFWADLGVKRIVLAREVRLNDIRGIADAVGDGVEIEAFVHGAMCVAYSGRCLLSAAMTGRSGNRGECTQSCRWEYALAEKTRKGQYFPIAEDGRGSYILNSKDLCMLAHLPTLSAAGVTSFKIEGRAKTAYYLATVVNAYRRAIDAFAGGAQELPPSLLEEPYKTSHRKFHTGFYFGDAEQYTAAAKPEQSYEQVAVVLRADGHTAVLEQRNRFCEGEETEILSPSHHFGKKFTIGAMYDESGTRVTDAKLVQQHLCVETSLLHAGDILRRKARDTH